MAFGNLGEETPYFPCTGPPLHFGFPVLFLCFMSSSVNAGRCRFCFCMFAVRTLIRFLFYVELGHVKLPHIWLERHRRSSQQII